MSGILPKFQQSLNFFATTSYDEIDKIENERIWMRHLLQTLQKVHKAEYFEAVIIHFNFRTGTVYPQVRKIIITKFSCSILNHRTSLSPHVFASLAERLISRVAEKIEVVFLFLWQMNKQMNNDSFNIQETMSRLKIMSQHGCLSFEQDIRILMHHLCDMLPMIQVLQKIFLYLLK